MYNTIIFSSYKVNNNIFYVFTYNKIIMDSLEEFTYMNLVFRFLENNKEGENYEKVNKEYKE